MRKYTIIREPAFICDLLYAFTIRFNKDICISRHSNAPTSAEDSEAINKIYKEYKDIPNELNLFFSIRDSWTCIITSYYYSRLADKDLTTRKLYDSLSDIDLLKKNVTSFFFPDLVELCDDDAALLKAVNASIKESRHSDTLKSSLYSFYIDPCATASALIKELSSVEAYMREKYAAEYESKLERLESELDIDALIEKLNTNKMNSLSLGDEEELYVSFAIYAHNTVRAYVSDEGRTIIILGSSYNTTLDQVSKGTVLPDLNSFGNAMSEKNRMDILDLMISYGELTIKDLEQELGLTGTNAYYHLNLMIRANVVKARNIGRTVYYSINKEYISSVIRLLKKYI